MNFIIYWKAKMRIKTKVEIIQKVSAMEEEINKS